MKETVEIGLPKVAWKFIEDNLINTNSWKVYKVVQNAGYLGETIQLREFYLTGQRIVREEIEKTVFHDGYQVYTCLVSEEGETLYSWEDNA